MMGILSGYNYREVTRKLKKFGCVCKRQSGGSHEIWFCTKNGRYTTIPNHGGKDIKEGTLRAILRQVAISVDDFLSI